MAGSGPLHAVIMAGGVGERFWPLSRRRHPKQLLSLVSERPLIAETVARVRPLAPPERTWIVLGRSQVEDTAAVLPDLPPASFIAEPMGRNTAPCVGLAAMVLARRAPAGEDPVMAVLPADHHIADEPRFRALLEGAAELARGGAVVTLGITPTRPETGYGYIEQGEPQGRAGGAEVFRARRFVEKPDAATAQRYLELGTFSWNAGIFVFSAGRILRDLERCLPEIYAGLVGIGAALGRPDYETLLERAYGAMPKVSIDVGVMEKLDDILMLPADIGWSDVGGWEALHELEASRAGDDGNVIRGAGLVVGGGGCYVRSEAGRQVVVVGADDLVVIDTPDALLVVPRGKGNEVREAVRALRERGKEELL